MMKRWVPGSRKRAERRGRWQSGRKEIREGRVGREGERADPVASAHEEDRDEGEGLRGRKRRGDLGFYFPRSLGSFSLIRATGQGVWAQVVWIGWPGLDMGLG